MDLPNQNDRIKVRPLCDYGAFKDIIMSGREIMFFLSFAFSPPRGDSTGNFLDFSSAASFRQQRFFVSSEYSSAAIFQRRDFVVRNSSEGVIKSSISLFIIPIQFLFTYSCRYVDMFKDGLLLSSYSSLFERPVFGNTLIFLDFECMANSITLMCKLDIA